MQSLRKGGSMICLTCGNQTYFECDVETMQEVTRDILRSIRDETPLKGDLGENGRYWFYLYSLICSWGGVTLSASILAASIFNTSVFLLAVYWFSQVVFREMQFSSKALIFISSAAVFFTFFHFGINIFAFIRYYALAPVILNFVLYFSIMAITIDFFRVKEWNIKYLVVAGVIFYASLHIHRQEALFALLMVSIMSFYLFAQKHAANIKLLWQGQAGSSAYAHGQSRRSISRRKPVCHGAGVEGCTCSRARRNLRFADHAQQHAHCKISRMVN